MFSRRVLFPILFTACISLLGFSCVGQRIEIATPEKLELTNAVLRAHAGNPYERQVHYENLSYAAR